MANVIDWWFCETDWFHTIYDDIRPVAIELGCGHGEYALALERSRPDAPR